MHTNAYENYTEYRRWHIEKGLKPYRHYRKDIFGAVGPGSFDSQRKQQTTCSAGRDGEGVASCSEEKTAPTLAVMVLVDTSIWISHFRKGDPRLKELLLEGYVICHPFIIGELACGDLKNRGEIISLLQALPQARIADNDEVLEFIERKKLMGNGIGLIDVHLLASSLLTDVALWTSDRRLKEAAARLNVLYDRIPGT